MVSQKLYISLFIILYYCKYISQRYITSQPGLQADGEQLLISYDVITKHSSDQFYRWIEIRKSNGDFLQAKTLNAEIGGNVKAGSSRKIPWWLMRVSVYRLFAGRYIYHKKYLDCNESCKIAEDLLLRGHLLEKA